MQQKTKGKPTVATISWRQLKTNPYNQRLAGAMLNDAGLVLKREVKTKGLTQYDDKREAYVVYDSCYFYEKLRKVLLPLLEDGLSRTEIIDHVRLALYGETGLPNDQPQDFDEEATW
jgi:hypothetical protein